VLEIPPKNPWYSTKMVVAPLRAAAIAAAIPAAPDPTTSASALRVPSFGLTLFAWQLIKKMAGLAAPPLVQ